MTIPDWFDGKVARFYMALGLAFTSVCGLVSVVNLWVGNVPAGLFFVFLAIPSATYSGERLIIAVKEDARASCKI